MEGTADRHRPGAMRVPLVLLLGMAAVWVLLAAIVGAIAVTTDDTIATASGGQPGRTVTPGAGSGTLPPVTDPVTGQVIDPVTGQVVDPVTGQPVPTVPGGAPAPTVPGGGPAPTGPPVLSEGDRTGVSDSEVKWGVHAPLTIGGAPVALAEDPVTGVETYLQVINQSGGINGRMITMDLQDDRYESRGGATAATALIEHGNFFISGTLGVDQIAVVATEAKARGIPYLGGGGIEQQFAEFGVFQQATSYDTAAIQLARFIKSDPDMQNLKIGVVVLDSPYLLPVADIFKAEAARLGLTVVATKTIGKPTDQTTYGPLLRELKAAGVQLYIPFHDPISTARIVTTECAGPPGPGNPICPWTYTFSNFAHESDVALTLFAGKWGDLGVKGLAFGCYYLAPTAYDPAHCAQMGTAHAQWVAIRGEESWAADGQGGSAGYQLVHIWTKAMTDVGIDLTRERFTAALSSYSNYSNLVSSPITFAGTNFAHGSDLAVPYQAGTDEKYRQLSDGFIGF